MAIDTKPSMTVSSSKKQDEPYLELLGNLCSDVGIDSSRLDLTGEPSGAAIGKMKDMLIDAGFTERELSQENIEDSIAKFAESEHQEGENRETTEYAAEHLRGSPRIDYGHPLDKVIGDVEPEPDSKRLDPDYNPEREEEELDIPALHPTTTYDKDFVTETVDKPPPISKEEEEEPELGDED